MKQPVRVQSLDRAFDILTLLGAVQDGATLSEISEQLDLPKSTTHRLLNAMSQRAFVRKSEKSGLYSLGHGLIELCANHLNTLELKTESLPLMDELSAITGNIAFLAIRQQHEIVYIGSREQVTSLRDYSMIGQRRPLYASSLGKALLMDMDESEIRYLLKDVTFEKIGPNTHPNIDSLLGDLRECRRRGWALDNQETKLNVHCVAAPIYDYRGHIIAAVSTSWLIPNRPEITPESIAPMVMHCTRTISEHMGWIGKSTR